MCCVSCSGIRIGELKGYAENEKNGLRQTVSSDGTVYRLGYLPPQLVYYNNEKGRNLSEADMQAYVRETGDMPSFLLDVEIGQTASSAAGDPFRQTYENTMNTALLTLDMAGKKHRCILYHCEARGGKKYRIDLAFEVPGGLTADFSVSFADPVTGRSPLFHFERQSILDIPQIKL